MREELTKSSITHIWCSTFCPVGGQLGLSPERDRETAWPRGRAVFRKVLRLPEWGEQRAPLATSAALRLRRLLHLLLLSDVLRSAALARPGSGGSCPSWRRSGAVGQVNLLPTRFAAICPLWIAS